MRPLRSRARGLQLLTVALGLSLLGIFVPADADDPTPVPRRPPGPTRVMLAGDSITQGRAGDFTYRYWLWRGLRDAGADIDLVGPRQDLAQGSTSYLDPGFDRDHAALFGSKTAYHLLLVTDEIRTYRPDVVVLMIGFNDLRVRSPEETAANVRTYVERVRAADPEVDLVIGQVTTGMSLSSGVELLPNETSTLNALLAEVVDELTTSRSQVVLARTAEGWEPGIHTWDGVHPTPTGETRIAQRMGDALVDVGAVPAHPVIDRAVPWPATYAVSGVGRNRRITLSWDGTLVDGWAGRVRYRLVAPEAGPWRTTSWAAGSSRTLRHLRAGGTYELQVQARRRAMIGGWSAAVRVEAEGRVPRAVRRTTVVWRTKRLRVRWREAAAASTYTVAYRTRTRRGTWTAWRTTTRARSIARLAVPRRAARVQVRITGHNGYLAGRARTVRSVRPR
ncbi:hypothetical protein FE697_008015 [Mumia zhuanghuii]|uniref:GDSL-type esterase/lipase family protein n=2 Tax=Mumia TaxID=1546255 RepID=A0ABW1QIG6_9ACTN|nr:MULTISPECIES: GDSL-type esterase/lipase family protein [Mumia]KAA1423533.1 hypothetical protein FE697_008015 [Mumia zhuanghuii]